MSLHTYQWSMTPAAGGGGDSYDPATTRYIRAGASGANNGTDWTNAYSSMPATLTRGYTYYIADSSYGGYTFDDAVSGTALITLKKATASGHGTDTGWSSTYGDGQAVFGALQIYTDYYVIDGKVRNSNWRAGGVNQYGISASNTRMDNGSGTGANNITFRYVDFSGGGRDTGFGDDVIYILTGGTNITFQYCALRDADRCIWLTRGTPTNWLIEYCYVARNTSTEAVHGEPWSLTDASNITFRYNAVEDIEGTGGIVGINGGTATGLYVYGNTWRWTSNYDVGRPAHSYGIAGIVNITHDASNNNYGNDIRVYNNTIYKAVGTYSGVRVEATTGGSNECYNNMWYSCCRCAHTGVTLGYNWYYNISVSDDDSSGTKQVASSGTGWFADGDGGDFHLLKATDAGTTLSSPYATDADGIARGNSGVWDRGAYEY